MKDAARIKMLLTLNDCHLADVRDANTRLAKEWDRLQVERQRLLKALAKEEL